MILPPKNLIPYINEEDPKKYYFLPITGYFYKKRLKNTLFLLGQKKYEKLLEIAFGSGILLPELSLHTKKLYGLETHEHINKVENMLTKLDIGAELTKGSLMSMPYPDNSFDCIVAVSVMEHIRDLDTAFSEIKRVLAESGTAIISFPTRNLAMRAFFSLAGYKTEEIHPSTHRDIIKAAKKYFVIEDILPLPKYAPLDYALYCSIRCRKINQ